jgi:hypothetical protein
MSHLQANLKTSELLSSVILGAPKCLLLTVLFVSKAADSRVVMDGLLSWCSFHVFDNWGKGKFRPLPMPPHVHYGLGGLPSRLWPKCNRLLRLGRP